MEKSYAGKIKNRGSQKVEAIFKTEGSKKPTVKTGGDLRAKKSSK
jgi:hypothetical protein